MVEELQNIKGYNKLSDTDKVKYAVALKYYLDDIEPDILKDMDILDVRKSAFKIPFFYCTFLFGKIKKSVTIEFKRNMIFRR